MFLFVIVFSIVFPKNRIIHQLEKVFLKVISGCFFLARYLYEYMDLVKLSDEIYSLYDLFSKLIHDLMLALNFLCEE